MTPSKYVHGYTEREAERLSDQAATLAHLLHHDTRYPPGATVLEPGCGTGAQTVLLAASSPLAHIVSLDVSPDSLAQARARVQAQGQGKVSFQQGDVFHLSYGEGAFDHVFVCFLLEHLERPLEALGHLKRVLKPGGSITVIEGDHGSCYFHPETPAARRAWQCLIDCQAGLGGDSLVGRRVFPLLVEAGFNQVRVSPRLVYCDASRPQMVEGFVRRTIIPMVEGVRQPALAAGMMSQDEWDQGIADLHQTAEAGGSFLYTFFKGVGLK